VSQGWVGVVPVVFVLVIGRGACLEGGVMARGPGGAAGGGGEHPPQMHASLGIVQLFPI